MGFYTSENSTNQVSRLHSDQPMRFRQREKLRLRMKVKKNMICDES